jgi:hypothetical protein
MNSVRLCATAGGMTHIEKMRFQPAVQELKGKIARVHQIWVCKPTRRPLAARTLSCASGSANPNATRWLLEPYPARLGAKHCRRTDLVSFVPAEGQNIRELNFDTSAVRPSEDKQ